MAAPPHSPSAPRPSSARIPDPLSAREAWRDEPHPPSYWGATAGLPPPDDGVLAGDLTTEVAIIGAGYTGLSCAYHLATAHGVEAVVLEANRPGWGCSGRNGSFARPAIGRLPYGEWVRRWGGENARAMFDEALEALATVKELIERGSIACDRQPDGWLKIAHRPEMMTDLREEQRVLREVFGFETDLLAPEVIVERYFRGGEAHGALRWPVSFAMHPLKLANGVLRMARAGGAKVFSGTPVTAWTKDGAWHRLATPAAVVRARKVVVATNGYTLERLFGRLQGRLLPVLSNIVVTQPLTPDETAEGCFRTTDVMTDTRKMLYYYRRLPDDRIMLGGRGPIRDTPRAMETHERRLLDAIRRKFPFVRKPRAEYFWGGWVALTRDSVPHVGLAEEDPSVGYALGYMGSGVSFSLHAGRRLASCLASGVLDLPAPVRAPLPAFPFPAFRRLGQWLVMRYYAAKDRS